MAEPEMPVTVQTAGEPGLAFVGLGARMVPSSQVRVTLTGVVLASE